jgi:hypothetical protein
MTIQLSTTVRDAQNDAIETVIGTTPWLDIRTGAQPANCGSADAGSELEHMALPSDWLGASSGGVKVKAGTWSSTVNASGTAAHFRIKSLGDTVCHMQGSITATSGGGDMEIDNIVLATGQTLTINTFTLTAGNP